eukprot:CAMPEP_0204828528 /NCGR_PEP_ID=MMETSP1346-20131115/6355_1 /ASSEMBLY_ACC=CAM_ASM_000771 /TAXON_ID=215587 /ORGANISM="Aplanochytrium stocchinoi, Strain GSBS06" /LENGTH=403 /DNA_ID=CAMNT_0051957667 /DNA_START=100 /DNA_END=1308 /DNA_ORIENTATION=-
MVNNPRGKASQDQEVEISSASTMVEVSDELPLSHQIETHENSTRRALEAFQQNEELRIALNLQEGSSAGNNRNVNQPSVKQNIIKPLSPRRINKQTLENVNAFNSLTLDDEELEDSENDGGDSNVTSNDETSETQPNEKKTESCSGGRFQNVAEVILEHILMYVGEYYFPRCHLVSKEWNAFFKRESLWRTFCLYFFVKPAYHSIGTVRGRPRKFRTWKSCYDERKRVKCCGLYTHRHKYIRDPGPRTMWSPDDHSKFVEITHYRYILFLRDGKALYASTPSTSNKMEKEFRSYVTKYYALKQLEQDGTESHQQVDADVDDNESEKGILGLEPDLPLSYQFFEAGAFERSHANRKHKIIYPATYKVRNGELVLLINLDDYSVKFHFEIDSTETIVKTKHESIW